MKVLRRLVPLALASVAALAIALVMAGCSKVEDSGSTAQSGTSQTASVTVSADALKGQHLVFAGYDAFKPFRYIEMQDDGSKKVVGLDIAVADELSRRLGFTYEFQAMPFASILASVQEKKADFSMGFTQNSDREKVYDFTQGYFQPRVGVVSTKGTDIKSIDDLKGKRIGVVTGTVQYTMAQKLLAGEDIRTYDNSDLCLQELLSGRIDAYICDGAEAINMAEPHEELQSNVLDKDFSTEYLGEYHIMSYKGAEFMPYFDQALTDMKNDGTLDKLIAQWVGADFTYGDQQ